MAVKSDMRTAMTLRLMPKLKANLKSLRNRRAARLGIAPVSLNQFIEEILVAHVNKNLVGELMHEDSDE